MRHKAGGYIPPLAGVFHGGGQGVSPFTVVEDDVRHGAGAVHEVVYVHEDASRPDLEGELLHVRGLGSHRSRSRDAAHSASALGRLGSPLECQLSRLSCPQV